MRPEPLTSAAFSGSDGIFDWVPRLDPRLEKLLAGERLEFRPKSGEESEAERESRTIPADWLEDLASKRDRLITVQLDILNAIIAGETRFRNANFQRRLSFTACEFTEFADFSFATFESLVTFQRCHFKQGVGYQCAHAKKDLVVSETFFEGETNFREVCVDGNLHSENARFGLMGADFRRIAIGKDARFDNTIFGGKVTFLQAHVTGNADFPNAKFRALPHEPKAADFTDFRVDGCAILEDTTFDGDVSFLEAQIGGDAIFKGARFTATAEFSFVKVGGSAFFCRSRSKRPTVFQGTVRFLQAQVGKVADFRGVNFVSPERPTVFEGIKVGQAWFCPEMKRGTVRPSTSRLALWRAHQ